ncbi:type II toxin-antitoxin system VapC family toxin [Wenzhouxiangella sediminis]|uniref:Type II toxin-antitoxin system VapC family toxin n=1 Tax=Wenzhouxiangella sediminis TaxID=1792836 RepID=A0A3E1K8S9_9GAMM|nr:type II toxin-antitoxin system VapC family toxin [Wenzhouxiangella sediminis]RFF30111.1 type II toxin-antitoxin system VapC family toxin [Wenzhouxiangella sediminis]
MIVLDTHALVWWVTGDSQLSEPALQAIEAALTDQRPVMISTISAWELAMLVAKDRLILTMDLDEWLDTVDSIEGVEWVPVTRQVAVDSVNLPGEFHQDPADRLIVALARHENAELISADRRIQDYPHVRCTW